MKTLICKALFVGILLAGFQTQLPAAVIAYWRFEDGTSGANITSATDSSGNGNTLALTARTGVTQTANPTFVPTATTGFLDPIPQTGADNDFGAQGFNGGYVLSKSNFSFFQSNTSSWTIEFFFQIPTGVPAGNYVSLSLGNTVLNISLGAGGGRIFWPGIQSTSYGGGANNYDFTVTNPNAAHSFALVRDVSNKTMTVFIDGIAASSGYANTYAGAAVNASFIVVGGKTDNNPQGYSTARLDEVRISNEALLPSQFLSAVPEPGVAGLALVGGAGIWFLQRRRKSLRAA